LSPVGQDVGAGQIHDVLNIKSHGVVLANPNIIVRRFAIPIGLLVQRLGTLDHLEDITQLRSLQGSAGEDAGVLLATLYSDTARKTLGGNNDVSGLQHRTRGLALNAPIAAILTLKSRPGAIIASNIRIKHAHSP
jgi:hypothetical protein